MNHSPKLSVLSFGGGQDSTVILIKLIQDAWFREKYAPEDLLVIISDTGDEHQETYDHVDQMLRRARERGVETAWLRPAMGFHSEKWQSLRGFYRRTNTIGSKAFPKTCTDKLKLVPIYRYLSEYVAAKYSPPSTGKRYRGKQPLVDFAAAFGKIRVMLGIAAGEESRVADEDKLPKWMQLSIERSYPLIDVGWDRSDCIAFMQGNVFGVPIPSNCMLCPYMNLAELLWLYRFHPKDYDEWVELEANKIAANKHKGDKNLGVWGKKLLPEVLREAIEKHGHMTDEELWDYKMTHGHNVRSKY